jgi:hypothetical protein
MSCRLRAPAADGVGARSVASALGETLAPSGTARTQHGAPVALADDPTLAGYSFASSSSSPMGSQLNCSDFRGCPYILRHFAFRGAFPT